MNEAKVIDLTEETKVEETPKKETKNIDKKIIYLIIVVLIIVTIGLYFLLKKEEGKNETQSDRAINYVEKLGKDFYEDYYYEQIETIHQNDESTDIKSFLTNFEENGISVTLNKVIELHFKTKETIDKELSKYDCNYDETKFIIFPKDPYEKNSYKIEAHLSCKNLKVNEK